MPSVAKILSESEKTACRGRTSKASPKCRDARSEHPNEQSESNSACCIRSYPIGVARSSNRSVVEPTGEPPADSKHTSPRPHLGHTTTHKTATSQFSLPLLPVSAVAGWNGVDAEGINIDECDQMVVPYLIDARAEFLIIRRRRTHPLPIRQPQFRTIHTPQIRNPFTRTSCW